MKQEQDHINTYSAADIQQYLEGKLSAADMHAIEKAALDDPFLADAIEGYAVGKKEQQNKDLQALKVLLEERIKNEKKKNWLAPVWLRAAVIVLAVAAGGLSFYKLFTANTEGKDSPLAKNEKISQAKADTATVTVNEQPKTDSQAIVQIETNLFKDKDSQATGKKRVGRAKQDKPDAASASTARNLQTPPPVASRKDEAGENLEAIAANRDINETKEEAKGNKAFDQYKVMNAFSGKVLDSKSKPVAGATILAKNRKVSTVTDMNGNFNFSSPDTALNIEVSSLGYQKNNATLKNNSGASNNIILQEANASLDEVVVVGYGATKSKKEERAQKRDSARLKASEAEPLVTWDEYNTYIISNKRKTAGDDDIDGEVILSFDVDQDNKLSNIKVEKSLSQELDKEAIRLVTEGPQWKPKKGKKAKGKLAIKF